MFMSFKRFYKLSLLVLAILLLFYPRKRIVFSQAQTVGVDYAQNVINGDYRVTVNGKEQARFALNAKGGNSVISTQSFTEVMIDVVKVALVDINDNIIEVSHQTGKFNLLELQNDMGLLFLHNAPLPAGLYKQIRLVLSPNGNTVTDNQQTYPLTIPSSSQSGLKIDGEFTIISGFFHTMTLNFNTDNIHYSPGSGYIMRPVIQIQEFESMPPFIPGYLIVITKEKLEISKDDYGLPRITNIPEINQLNDELLCVRIRPYLSIFEDDNSAFMQSLKESEFGRKYYFYFYSSTDIIKAMFLYSRLDSVEEVYPNSIVTPSFLPQDIVAQPNAGQGSQGPYLKAINAYAGWDKTHGSTNIKIGLIDTGVDTRNYDLSNRIKKQKAIYDGWCQDDNICDACGCYTPDPYSCTVTESNASYIGEHGTAVAGILAAPGDNGTDGIAGINWRSPIYSYRTMQYDQSRDSDSSISCKNGNNICSSVENNTTAILEAIKDGANVINMSMSHVGIHYCWYDPWQNIDCFNNMPKFYAAIKKAESNKVVVVASVGNGDEYNNDHIGDWTCPGGVINGCETVQVFPAGWSTVISVASMIVDDVSPLNSQRTSLFSNYGKVDVAAPGEDILTTYPGIGNNKYYAIGTSMAAPMVAGLASLILSLNDTLRPAEVRQIIYDSARDIGVGGGNAASNCYTGPGKDACTGHGMINIGSALAQTPPQPPNSGFFDWGSGCN